VEAKVEVGGGQVRFGQGSFKGDTRVCTLTPAWPG
jgi:hypothetical protein